jgi:hypothetical protein
MRNQSFRQDLCHCVLQPGIGFFRYLHLATRSHPIALSGFLLIIPCIVFIGDWLDYRIYYQASNYNIADSKITNLLVMITLTIYLCCFVIYKNNRKQYQLSEYNSSESDLNENDLDGANLHNHDLGKIAILSLLPITIYVLGDLFCAHSFDPVIIWKCSGSNDLTFFATNIALAVMIVFCIKGLSRAEEEKFNGEFNDVVQWLSF